MSVLWLLLQTLPTTLLLWFSAQILGIGLAIPVSFARMSQHRLLRTVALWWIEVFRGVPTLVLLFIVFFGLSVNGFSPDSMTAAVLALGFSSSGYLAESIRAGFESVPRQQHEAALALSLSPLVKLRKVLLPQAFPIISEGVVSYSIHLFKETALASLIGVIDLMAVAYYLVERGADGSTVFLFVGGIYLAVCLLLAWIAHTIGQAKRGRRPKIARKTSEVA